MMTVDQVLAAHKAHVETLFGLTGKALEGVEKLVELNLATSKAVLADSAAQTQSLLSVKDAHELLALQSSLLQPLGEKALAYGRDVYEIASATSAEFGKTLEAQIADVQKKMMDVIDNTAQNAPVGSETAVALMKSAAAAASAALETAQKSAKQAMAMAESNLKAITATTLEASKTSAKKNAK